eukprot:CAMPEP_0196573170 /NCGR_PEP_ID=MMETSP1081-20130531/3112_1 /TAXON_ID=36882 /ORGANISM="Pyramimonas amylifera, Strain CCMP720" /LENGTH=279 /DNA_ID=CAMNT_0041890789 /DNA_START=281 /DNA_END=1120 /DNA_ORIENTATION=-
MCGHLWTRETFSDEFPLKGIVYFAHGMGEHAFAYRHFGDRLATAGYALLAMDHFGHGKSDGARMSLGFDQAVKDYLYFIESTWTQYPATLPRFLLGQSFGGLLAIHVALHRQARWAGVILTAAAVGVDWDASKLAAYALFSTLAKCGILPDIPVLPAFSGREICRDVEGASNYDTDPLIYHGKLKTRIALETMQAMMGCKSRYSEFKVPLLVLHGTRDITTSLPAAQTFCKSVSSPDATFRKLEGLAHLLFMEPERLHVMKEIVHWIDMRAKPHLNSKM